MKHDPRSPIHAEKQLGWAPELGGAEPLGISRVRQTVLALSMEYQIRHPPTSSVALGSEEGQWLLPTFLSGRKLFPSSCLDARHFGFPQHATGAFQAATPVLELRGSESE